MSTPGITQLEDALFAILDELRARTLTPGPGYFLSARETLERIEEHLNTFARQMAHEVNDNARGKRIDTQRFFPASDLFDEIKFRLSEEVERLTEDEMEAA